MELPTIFYKGNECVVDFKLGEMRCTKIDISKLSKIRQKHGLETDSGSRWFFLVNQGLSSSEAEYKVFKEKRLIKPSMFKTIKFTDLKEDKNSQIKKELRRLRFKTWRNDYIKGVDD